MKNKVSQTQKVLNVWAIILILWSIYRAKLSLPEWFDEFIAKPVVFLGPIYIFLTRFEERKNISEELGLTKKGFFTDIKLALIIGVCFSATALLANFVKSGGITYDLSVLSKNGVPILYALLLALATGISEEILSRGFVLKQLYQESGNAISSAFLSSIFFLILHIPILFTNLKLSGTVLLLFMATDFILALVNSFIFLDRKSLTAPILIHALYNMAILLYI